MKRIMLLIIAMLLSAMLSMMAIANENNYFNGDILFRDHEWGESLEEVMKTEIEDGMVEDVGILRMAVDEHQHARAAREASQVE